MGLDLKGTPVSSRTTKERTQKALDILQEIQGRMAAMGLQPYPRPKNTPERSTPRPWPASATASSRRSWRPTRAMPPTCRPSWSRRRSRARPATINLNAVKQSLKTSLFKDRTLKSEIDAKVQTSPEYIEYELEHLKLYRIKEILGRTTTPTASRPRR